MQCPRCQVIMVPYRVRDERDMSIHVLAGHFYCLICKEMFYEAMGQLMHQFIWELAFIEV